MKLQHHDHCSTGTEEGCDCDAAQANAYIAHLWEKNTVLERENRQLNDALGTSRMIGAAVGILMQNRKISSKDAFHALVRMSQLSQRKLRLVAADIVELGDVDWTPPPAN